MCSSQVAKKKWEPHHNPVKLNIRRKRNQTDFRPHVSNNSILEYSGTMYKTPSRKENVTPKIYSHSNCYLSIRTMDSSIMQEFKKCNSPLDLEGFLDLDTGTEIIWLFHIIVSIRMTGSTTQR